MTIGRIPSVEGGIQPTIVDAKGDLIAGVAADSVNRLAVGSNDQVLVADSSTSTGMAWKSYGAQFVAGKNKIINGDFAINQRGFSSTVYSGSTFNNYGFDRWATNNAGDGTTTASLQTFTVGTAPVAGYEAKNFYRAVTAGFTNAASRSDCFQFIEDVRTFAGQTVTVSFWAKAGSGTPKIGVEIGQGFGTGGSPSSTVYTAGGAITISTSWTRYSTTINVPSISGKTLGTANDSNLAVRLFFSAGSDIATRASSIGIQNNTFDIWGVQVEAGSVATPFTTATGTLQGELAACQRYYFRNTATNNAYAVLNTGTGSSNSTTALQMPVPLSVPMRVVPTNIDASNLCVDDGSNIVAVTSVTIGSNSSPGSIVVTVNGTGFTQYRPYRLAANNNTAAFFGLSAEL